LTTTSTSPPPNTLAEQPSPTPLANRNDSPPPTHGHEGASPIATHLHQNLLQTPLQEVFVNSHSEPQRHASANTSAEGFNNIFDKPLQLTPLTLWQDRLRHHLQPLQQLESLCRHLRHQCLQWLTTAVVGPSFRVLGVSVLTPRSCTSMHKINRNGTKIYNKRVRALLIF
jgi:hypothetical protein